MSCMPDMMPTYWQINKMFLKEERKFATKWYIMSHFVLRFSKLLEITLESQTKNQLS